ncbi:MAG: manganese efflux pump MntP family protein [Moraxella sp.]|uniref:manganese efflux pump MntP n=1 Tax=Moraxella sp. TaxID=479 RepID=UPI0026DB99D2|nr:manganese efflux pump MntP family protein [Moraxella sp.]MDO4449391.1 manganese efflux pump MntP family protein [Moraxella sp.]
MNIITLAALSFGMSMDAFAASVVRGASADLSGNAHNRLLQAFKIGIVFGIVEAITPVIGYYLGVLAQDLVQGFDHWVSFILLGGLGVHLIYEAMFGKDDDGEPVKNSLAKTILTAFATSIDAMIIGVSLAFLEVNIWLASFLIGMATTIMATFGVYLGAKIGKEVGNKAQIMGGIVLIGIGIFILVTHLMAH